MAVAAEVVESITAEFSVLLPHLDERQRRLAMAARARSLGHGGIAVVARAAGVSALTVSKGVAELEAGAAPLGRVRRAGAGRKRAADCDPQLTAALVALVEPGQRGDPMSPLRWTTTSTRKLAGQLTGAGHAVSAWTVANLLREQGFSLQGNAKQIEGRQHPDRDAQFGYLNTQAAEHLAAGQPVISVDTKKKELVGNYKNGGQEYRPKGEPEQVKVYDFVDQELGKAIPYGVYDLAGNTGWVSVGTDPRHRRVRGADHPHLVAAGRQVAYRHATRLLISADGGGSNGYRVRLWKTELAHLADETGLQITVCHLPPGTSKWNRIEHRLFCHISMNWRGRPLTSHEVIVNLIAATTTRTGLTVRANLDHGDYPSGINITNQQMRELEAKIHRHEFHGEWNYTFNPDDSP